MDGTRAHADIGVVGGSGLYDLEGLMEVEDVSLDTPFGRPSDSIRIGTLSGVRVAFLPRHGRGHRLLPSELPSRANIFAMKLLGVRRIVSASAVGSLREEFRPMDMAVPDGLFDRTKGRQSTFFGEGIVAHIAFGDPFCPETRAALQTTSRDVVERTHAEGTYVCIEGPAFSTRTESMVYRRLGFDIIGMTALPEAKLAREAGICYAVLAQVTDYDSWHADHESVTNDMVMQNVARNAANTKQILRGLMPLLMGERRCTCAHALADAIATAPEAVDEETRIRLAPLLTGTRLAPDS
ncbi:MAG TPA: S-methyl-5'-thioadenosine phosphorylase [Chloroflexota bacterium]